MAHPLPTISLGFTEQQFPPGVHICQIFGDDDERDEALLKFLLSGLQSGERAGCFSERIDEKILAAFLGRHGISYNEVRDTGGLTLAGTVESYFQNNRFEPERMLSVLGQFYEESVTQGYPAARIIGEMTEKIQHLPGGGRILEYEAKVSLLLREHPVTTVCQYDARLFEGAMIMDILKVHPYMVVRGSVVHNPFFITPEEFLAR